MSAFSQGADSVWLQARSAPEGGRTLWVTRGGFSLLELLLVISILGLLAQLLLPAVQSAREAARRAQCSNHLRQLGLAAASHVEARGHWPTGGWGMLWVGDPDRGYGPTQPGGWAYNLLPYLEQQALHDLPRGSAHDGSADEPRATATARMCQTVLPLLHCPTRRPARLYPYTFSEPDLTRNCDPLAVCAKTDYAANAGDFFVEPPRGPRDLDEGDSGRFDWIDPRPMTGVVFQRSTVRSADLTDGASQTYLFGEKYLSSTHYEDGWAGDNQTAWSGYDQDSARWTAHNDEAVPPLHDSRYVDTETFGSAHPAGCHFVFCDGSVHLIGYAIDGETHRRLGNRRDGRPIDLEAVLGD